MTHLDNYILEAVGNNKSLETMIRELRQRSVTLAIDLSGNHSKAAGVLKIHRNTEDRIRKGIYGAGRRGRRYPNWAVNKKPATAEATAG